jgi:hypothetical protein
MQGRIGDGKGGANDVNSMAREASTLTAVKEMADGWWWDHCNHVEEVKKVAVITALAVEVVAHRQGRRRWEWMCSSCSDGYGRLAASGGGSKEVSTLVNAMTGQWMWCALSRWG